jgi:Zn-dependent peptidase ImmA (M78 family)
MSRTIERSTNESLLRLLRDLVPQRRLTFGESLRIAELQANHLLEHFDVEGPRVPSELVTELPRIEVRYDADVPVSGSAHWERSMWIITLNAAEPMTRQRFSMMHELKHIIDHTTQHFLYGEGAVDPRAAQRAERAADHFAACVLMSKRSIKGLWFSSGQNVASLASQLQVSPRALSVRLWHLGLDVQSPRCPAMSRPYHRTPHFTYLRYTPQLAGAAPS